MKTIATIICIAIATICSAQVCSNDSTGRIPLTDTLTPPNAISRGLYPSGTNIMPATHRQQGQNIAATIKPLDGSGNVDFSAGKIVFASMGMSNAEQFFNCFDDSVALYGNVNPFLQTVNTALPGFEVTRFLDTTNRWWDSLDLRLSDAGLTRKQVQVIWWENVYHIQNIPVGEGAEHIDSMANRFGRCFRLMKIMFPNLKMLYCSGREYGGYCNPGQGNPEPYAYYTNWAFKQIVQRQINGETALKHPGTSKNPVCPWLAWSGNIWADGVNARHTDGLQWLCPNDVQTDGVHPSADGEGKVAHIMMDFFRTDSTCGWFRQ